MILRITLLAQLQLISFESNCDCLQNSLHVLLEEVKTVVPGEVGIQTFCQNYTNIFVKNSEKVTHTYNYKSQAVHVGLRRPHTSHLEQFVHILRNVTFVFREFFRLFVRTFLFLREAEVRSRR